MINLAKEEIKWYLDWIRIDTRGPLVIVFFGIGVFGKYHTLQQAEKAVSNLLD